MKKTILVFVAGLCLLSFAANAQNYSSDAMLVSEQDNVATIRCSGFDQKKKVATEMAVKSALYTYFFNGIQGLNNGRPLLGKNASNEAKEYANQLLQSGRYMIFVKGYVFDEKASKNLAKSFNAIVTTEIYTEAIYKDFLNKGYVGKMADKTSMVETNEEIALPSIMVLPYCKAGENYKTKIQNTPDIRIATAKVNEGFINKGVETKDLEQSLRNADAYQAKQANMSLNDIIVSNSGADVAVFVDIQKDQNPQGVRVTMILSAIEVATGKNIATKSETSARFNSSTDVICSALAKVMIDDFLRQISTALANKLNKGNSVAVSFTIDPSSATDMDTEISNYYLPLSDVLILWVKDNAKGGRYHQQGRSTTLLSLDEIQIKNKDANGQELDINTFSLELYKYLRSLGLVVKRTIVGNTIEIKIM